MNSGVLRLLVAVLAWAVGLSTAWAHASGLSVARARFSGDRLELTVSLAPSDAARLLPSGVRPKVWDEQRFATCRPALLESAELLYQVHGDGAPVAPEAVAVEWKPGDAIVFRLTYAAPAAQRWEFEALSLGALSPEHREEFSAEDAAGKILSRAVLGADAPVATVSLAPAAVAKAGWAQTLRTFGALGVEHIWTGYDHLLFLLAALLGCRGWTRVAAVVTSFTAAHSLTLAVATLGWATPPASWVEPLIAASIVFVGVENLLRPADDGSGRWRVTFLFGLIHGFGFATVLRELGVGRDGGGVVVPLLSFNLGVEFGQLALAAVLVPLLAWLGRQPQIGRRMAVGLSAIVAACGMWWLLERTVLA